jgi:hypothetical protein
MATRSGASGAAAESGYEAAYDVYLSAPMDAVDPEARAAFHEEVLRVRRAMEGAAGGGSVCCADGARTGIDQVLGALRNSWSYVALYPENGVSTVLVEVGIAVAEGLPIAIFTRDPEALAFPLGQAVEAAWKLRCYRAESIDAVIDLVTRHADEILG